MSNESVVGGDYKERKLFVVPPVPFVWLPIPPVRRGAGAGGMGTGGIGKQFPVLGKPTRQTRKEKQMQSHPIFTDEELDIIVNFFNENYGLVTWMRSGSDVFVVGDLPVPVANRALEVIWGRFYASRMAQVAS